ncbi:hypothetical protein [Phnomibacter sp. MR]|uniref:hypothetical protein n=1 Tax=Phnomibacter sp. MR TaxID=3042318 RepID=UPI003A80E2BE
MIRFFKDWRTTVVGASIGLATLGLLAGKISEDAFVKAIGVLGTIGFVVSSDFRKNNQDG